MLFITSFGQSPGIISFSKLEVFNQKNITAIAVDKLDNIWVGSDNGLFRFNGDSFQKIIFEPNSRVKDIYIDNKNNVLFVDDNSHIWIIYSNHFAPEMILSTFRKRNIEPIKNSFYSINDTVKFETIDNFTFNIINGKVNKIEKKTVKQYITNYFKNNTNQWSNRFALTLELPIFDSLISKSNNEIHDINFYYTAHKALLSFGSLFFSYIDSSASYSIIDKSVKFLLTNNGDVCYTRNHNLYLKYNNDTVDNLLYKNVLVSTIVEDNKHGIWIGTRKHGIMYIPNLNIHIFKHHTNFNSINQKSITSSANSVYRKIYSDDTIMLSVNSLVKHRYLLEINTHKYYFKSPYEINDCKIYNSKLWLATLSGLLRYNIKLPQNKLQLYGMNYGIPEYDYRKIYFKDSIIHLVSQNNEVYFNLKYCDPTIFSGFCLKSDLLEQKGYDSYSINFTDNGINSLQISKFKDYKRISRSGYVKYGKYKNWQDINTKIINISSKNIVIFRYTINPYFNNTKQVNITVENSDITQIYLIIMVILVFVILLVLLVKIANKRLKETSELSSIMQIVLQQQMSPHFIFNSLTSINHYILKNKPIEGSRYLTKFSLFIRNILNNAVKSEIPLYNELESLKIYLELEKLRFKDRFDYSITKDDYIDENQIVIPPFIIQPFVEASLHLGILNKQEKGFIKIFLKINVGYFNCTIVDNGVGRQKAKLFEEKNRTLSRYGAITIAEKRIALINKKNRRKIKLNIEDVENHLGEVEGSKFVLTIPIKNK